MLLFSFIHITILEKIHTKQKQGIVMIMIMIFLGQGDTFDVKGLLLLFCVIRVYVRNVSRVERKNQNSCHDHDCK
jgi:hypothetical protein